MPEAREQICLLGPAAFVDSPAPSNMQCPPDAEVAKRPAIQPDTSSGWGDLFWQELLLAYEVVEEINGLAK